MIAFCGVHFMAETAKILNPDKIVVIPDLDAGCSLADGCPAPAFAHWLEKYPGHTVVSYINCSAEVKALSDVICTSSNAVKIVKALGDQKIVFAPDRHLGAFVKKQANRPDLVLWEGTCVVHETFSERRLLELMAKYPDAEVIAHPECHDGILRHAAFIASTSGLIDYARGQRRSSSSSSRPRPASCTRWPQAAPGKQLIPAPPEDESCCVQRMPVHEEEHAREAVSLAARSVAAGRRARADSRARAAADPAHVRYVGMKILLLAALLSRRLQEPQDGSSRPPSAPHEQPTPKVPPTPIPATTTQLITAVPADWTATTATLRLWHREPGKAWNAVGEPWSAVIGATGSAWGIGLHGDAPPFGHTGPKKHEGDKKSPGRRVRDA